MVRFRKKWSDLEEIDLGTQTMLAYYQCPGCDSVTNSPAPYLKTAFVFADILYVWPLRLCWQEQCLCSVFWITHVPIPGTIQWLTAAQHKRKGGQDN